MNEELSVADELYRLSCWVLPAMAAIILHEIAHGYAALYFGDDTAKREGRLSLNPFKHVDPFGTVIFLCFWCWCMRRSCSDGQSPFPLIFQN